jgi:hypothetical protein
MLNLAQRTRRVGHPQLKRERDTDQQFYCGAVNLE